MLKENLLLKYFLKKTLRFLSIFQKMNRPKFRNIIRGCVDWEFLKYIDFRSAFRMPTSRSYPRHLIKFCWIKWLPYFFCVFLKKRNFFHLHIFFHFKKMQSFSLASFFFSICQGLCPSHHAPQTSVFPILMI